MMNPESWLDTRFAGAGLFAGVVVAWALRVALGGFDSDWILAGFLATGLGMLVFSVIGKLTARSPGAEDDEEPSDTEAEDDEEEDDEDEDDDDEVEDVEEQKLVSGPRLRVLLASAGLEALAVALLAAYFSGSMIIAVGAGVVAAGLAAGVSMVLARRFVPEDDEEIQAGAPKARKGSGT